MDDDVLKLCKGAGEMAESLGLSSSEDNKSSGEEGFSTHATGAYSDYYDEDAPVKYSFKERLYGVHKRDFSYYLETKIYNFFALKKKNPDAALKIPDIINMAKEMKISKRYLIKAFGEFARDYSFKTYLLKIDYLLSKYYS